MDAILSLALNNGTFLNQICFDLFYTVLVSYIDPHCSVAWCPENAACQHGPFFLARNINQAANRSLSILTTPCKILIFFNFRWPQMWYLNRGNRLDMNVQEAWLAGFTGKGVSVTILDDGIERSHPDLVGNYDPLASFDVNQNDNDPTPR